MERRRGHPDQGWSWVVAGAACFCSLVLAGIFRTGGVLFVVFIDTFGVSREEASWPMVVCIAVLNLTGPFSGMLSQKVGIRPVVILGSVIGAIGVSGCFFTTSLDIIIVLFGGVFGVGYGLINTVMPVIVNAYFLNLRGLANGIANSGSCFGSVIFPVFFEYLISSYGLSGCFLLTGGFVLNIAVVGALLRPPSWISTPNNCDLKNSSTCDPIDSSSLIIRRRKSSNAAECSDKALGKQSKIRDIAYRESNTEYNGDPHQSLHAELVEALRNRNKVDNRVSDTCFVYKDPSSISLFTASSSVCDENNHEHNKSHDELLRAQKEFQDSLSDFQNTVLSILETSQSEEILNKYDATDDVKTSALTDSCPARHSFSIRRPKGKLDKTAILSSRPLKKCNLKFESSSDDLNSRPDNSSKFKSVLLPEHKAVSIPLMDNIEEEKQEEIEDVTHQKDHSQSALKSFQSVLSSSMFYVTALTNVSFYFLYHMYVVIIVDYSLDCGVPENDTKYIIYAFSAADLFGRLCLGWITDRKYVTRSRFVMLCMAAIGAVFFAFPSATSYWTLIVASCGYGVLLGCTMIIFPILLVDYLGTELHAVSYGCLCFLNGFASLTRPLIIGYFRDNIGSYAKMFYILGIISVVAASAWLLERCFVRNPVSKANILEKDVKHEDVV